MANPITPVVDTDLENIKSQLEYAKALRGQSLDTKGETVSGFYVPKSPWLNFVQGLTGGGVESYQRGQQKNIEQGQQQERQDFLAAMPSATETQTYDPESNPGTGPLMNGEFAKSPLQQAKEMQKWAMGAPRGMEGVQNFALQQALTAPQREAEAAQKAQDRLQELQMKAMDMRASQAERLDAQRQIAQMQIEGRKETAQLVASLKASGGNDSKPDMRFIDTVDADGNPVKQVVDMNAVKPGDTFGKPAKAPTKAEEAVKKAMAAPGQIDQIMKEAESNKEAFGIVPAATTMLPNIVGSRLMSKVLTPDQQKARVKVQTQAAKVIHDVYGAALSRNEAFRAEGWAPDPRDDYESTMRKLQGAKEYSQMLAGENGGSPAAPAAPSGGGDKLSPAEQAELDSLRAKHPRKSP